MLSTLPESVTKPMSTAQPQYSQMDMTKFDENREEVIRLNAQLPLRSSDTNRLLLFFAARSTKTTLRIERSFPVKNGMI